MYANMMHISRNRITFTIDLMVFMPLISESECK